MCIGDAAKRLFHLHHPGSWTRRQGHEFRSYSPMTQPQPQPWLSWRCLSDSFFGTVFVNSWDQKKCPVYIASHMDAHSFFLFCFVLKEMGDVCFQPWDCLVLIIDQKNVLPPTQCLVLFLSRSQPFPAAFPIISQGKVFLVPLQRQWWRPGSLTLALIACF